MGWNVFKNSSEQKGKWNIDNTGMSRIDSGLRSINLSYNDLRELNSTERKAVQSAQRGEREIKLSPSQQRALISKAKKIEVKAKKEAKAAKEKAAWDKKTGTKRR